MRLNRFWTTGSTRPPAREVHEGWHRLPLASLDLETTGVDPRTDRVVSYALLDETGLELTGLVNPGIPVPAAASAVHGITDEMLRDAPGPAEGLAVVLDRVRSLIARRVALVVFNACYDLTMLRVEATRHGLDQPDWQRLLVIDPFVVDWGVEREARGPRRLLDVAAHYGITVENAHDAACDARAARQVAVALATRHAHIARMSLEDLMAAQRRWYAARAADWNADAARAGRVLDDRDGWPLAA